MSKPKEKAEELVNNYRVILMQTDTDAGQEILCTSIAKQCALIAVDEIIECYPAQCPKESYEMEQHIYWQEVKTEIKNL
jgi:hypothetical protein